MLLIHPPHGFVAQLLELPRQTLADLPGATLDLAPVTGLDLQTLRKAPLQTAQGGGIGVLEGGGNELFEQAHRVVQTDLRDVAGGGTHAAMIKLRSPAPGEPRQQPHVS